MVARVARLHESPAAVEQAVEQVKGMLEEFNRQPGFRSLTTLVSRETGECLGTSIWEDAEAERASRELGRRSRETSSEAGGTVTAPDVDVYEVGFEAHAIDVAAGAANAPSSGSMAAMPRDASISSEGGPDACRSVPGR